MPITVKREWVTPEVAADWLEKNTRNRNIQQAKVDEYARDMAAGRFAFTGESLKLAKGGTILDGQHRLWACVQSETPFEVLVVRGLPEDVQDVIDSGMKRTLAHAFQIKGIGDANINAGILNIAWRYERDRWTANLMPTHTEGMEYLQANPLLSEAVRVANAARRLLSVAPSPVGAAYFLNARIDAENADLFWEKATTGVGLEAGDPILALRRWVTSMLASRDRPAGRTQLGFYLKAMNAWREGKSLRILQWRQPDGLPNLWSD